MTILDQETISWHAVTDELPDIDITVLVCCPTDAEPVWLGWYDNGWFTVDAQEYEPDAVTAWAAMPRGPA